MNIPKGVNVASETLEEASDTAETSASNPQLHVLLVDDDPAFRRLCREFLESRQTSNYVVYEAATGDDAALCYADGGFDCVLIDYRLPDTSGTGLMRTLRPQGPVDMPMIILTGVGNEDIAMEAVHSGAADYLPKSRVNEESLDRTITNAIEKCWLRRSIEARTDDLALANDELVKKNDQIRRFYHTVSHEIKTPLTAAREFISLVADGVVGKACDDQRKMLRFAIDSLDQIATHFDDLIETTRLDTGKLRIERTTCNAGDLVERSVMTMLPAIQDSAIVLEQDLEPDLPALAVDGLRVVQVLTNLLSNAIRYTRPGGMIRVAAALSDNRQAIEFSVEDTGSGIAPEHLPRIFDRLYQAEIGADHAGHGGLGLGLSIAQGFVQLHNGTIVAESELGRGSRFVVSLPLDSEADSAGQAAAVG